MMHTTPEHFARPDAGAEGAFARAGRAVDRLLARLLERIERASAARRTAALIAQMDDHILRDIGLTRERAERLIRGLDD